jgi:hypothetical protein
MMSKIFTSRTSLMILVFCSGYLVASLTLTQGKQQSTDDPRSQRESQTGPSSPRSISDRSSGISQSEHRRLKLAEHWENADMDLIIGKMDSIKTFESNTFDTGLSQELCDYLAISRSESAVIDAALRSTAKELKKLQTSAIEATQVDDITSKFVIRKFPNQGGELKETLQRTLQETLGDNRYFLFRKISRHPLGFTFMNFGESDIHITMKTSGPPGNQRYQTRVSGGTHTSLFETQGVPPAFAHLIEQE